MTKDVDEDLIEATIRRVAESRALQDKPAIEMPVAESIAPVIVKDDEPAATADINCDDDAAPAPAPNSLRAQMQGLPTAPMHMNPARPASDAPAAPMKMPPPSAASAPRAPMQMPVRDAGRSSAAVAAVPRGDGDISAQLRAIAERLDAMLPLLERIAASQDAVTKSNGEWGRNPQSRGPVTPIRPAGPTGAPARAAPDSEIDTRPLPKPLPPLVEPKRGFDLLPRTYRITVEDKRQGVDLVPLHRAMLTMDGVRDMSLLSYNNGVAIVALETTDELDPENLRESVSHAMNRDARVEVHNENTMVVKLSEE